jgi:hypothetical protein
MASGLSGDELRQRLVHIRWIGGGTGSGKSTAAAVLAERGVRGPGQPVAAWARAFPCAPAVGQTSRGIDGLEVVPVTLSSPAGR